MVSWPPTTSETGNLPSACSTCCLNLNRNLNLNLILALILNLNQNHNLNLNLNLILFGVSALACKLLCWFGLASPSRQLLEPPNEAVSSLTLRRESPQSWRLSERSPVSGQSGGGGCGLMMTTT